MSKGRPHRRRGRTPPVRPPPQRRPAPRAKAPRCREVDDFSGAASPPPPRRAERTAGEPGTLGAPGRSTSCTKRDGRDARGVDLARGASTASKPFAAPTPTVKARWGLVVRVRRHLRAPRDASAPLRAVRGGPQVLARRGPPARQPCTRRDHGLGHAAPELMTGAWRALRHKSRPAAKSVTCGPPYWGNQRTQAAAAGT